MIEATGGRPIESGRYPEMWGGVECTVNRLREHFGDQLARSGHLERPGDIDRFADLGIRTLRFPLLWERMQPERATVADWTWSDSALRRARVRGVRPILGLLHHGYGPHWSGILDPKCVENLSRYAETVATRYPWVDAYTPVNEPLTTARFSGLYGHWYPHAQDPRIFARLLMGQCRAAASAMRAVRRVNPHAQLIQTEDLGKVSGTAALAGQCEFENERRWLTWDLLEGRVDPSHSLWSYLRELGISERELWEMVESPCPPDVIGVNYYVTSERFLDDRTSKYDPAQVGGNGRQRYADVATVSTPEATCAGLEALLGETWARYATPLAVTECHIGCTREEQLRWLHEAWDAGTRLRERGVDVRAVTTWALLGLHDWDSLVTQEQGHYESGAFDIRAPVPRVTAVGTMVRALATGGEYAHPVLDTMGWWHGADAPDVPTPRGPDARSLLIVGANGTLGTAFVRICENRGLAYRSLSRTELDITDHRSVMRAISRYPAWGVINAAGYVKVDLAEVDRDRCWNENVIGPAILAAVCRRHGIPLVTFSSDLVFNGSKTAQYVESDLVSPLNWYGITKVEAEARVLSETADALVIRTSAFFGPWDSYNLVTQALEAMRSGRESIVAHDVVVTPTYVPDLVHAALDLLLDGERGIWHLTNQTPVTWTELVRRAADRAHISTATLVARRAADLGFLAERPQFSALTSERGWIMPTLDDALARYVAATALPDVAAPEYFDEPVLQDAAFT